MLTNALNYSLIVAVAAGAHEYVTHYVNVSTTDPTTNKLSFSAVSSYTGGAGALVYVPSVDSATISMSSDGQVWLMNVYGFLK